MAAVAPKERTFSGKELEAYKLVIRPCPYYHQEFKDCMRIKARFHQYFIYGHFLDCGHWKRDFNSCRRWEEKNDEKSLLELAESEKKRRLDRLRPHVTNDVWEKRKSPPPDWNAPLPEEFQVRYENSYLKMKMDEAKDIKKAMANRFCTIL